MNYCPHCPNCHTSEDPCQDLFGSSATAEGGIFGRVDAVYTSIEAQKSGGSLHAHSQVYVQCLHQHTTIWDIVTALRKKPGDIVKDYLDYKTHVCRQVYTSSREEVEKKLNTLEQAWPEYKKATNLITYPEYLSALPQDVTSGYASVDLPELHRDGEAWLRSYLEEDVETLQMMKQHLAELNPFLTIRQRLCADIRRVIICFDVCTSPNINRTDCFLTNIDVNSSKICNLWIITALVNFAHNFHFLLLYLVLTSS